MATDNVKPQSASERTLLEGVIFYISILLKYKWMIIGITAVAAILVLAFSIITLVLPPEKSPLPNQYKAQATLIVQESESGGLDTVVAALGLALPGPVEGVSGSLDYGQLALMVLNSRIILDPLVEEFDIINRYEITGNVRTASRDAILSRAEFNYTRTSGVLTISYESIDPVYSRDMVNRMVELLNDWFVNKGGTTKQKQKDLLEKKLAEVSTEIEDLENEIEDFQRTYGVLTVEELAAAQSKVLADLRAQLVLKEMEIKNYTRFSRIEDPELLRLQSERDNLQELIGQNESRFGGLDLPSLSLEFARMRMALDIQTRIFESLSEQYEITKLTLESEPVFQILELAEAPDEKTSPSRSKICLVATVVAFFFSVFLAFILHAVKQLRSDPSRLRRIRGRVE
jgi:tyrosine-protein kinase Etk/Wzc